MNIDIHRWFANFRRVMLLFAVTLLIVIPFSTIVMAATQIKQDNLHDDLFSVTFSTENDGWACGRWGTVLHTSDGGKTWEPQGTGIDYTLSSIYFTDSNNGWAVGDEGTIIHTKDGGKSWEKQKSPVKFFLSGVHFVSPSKGWVVTERTHILYTENGGKTWKVQFREDDFILKGISFSDTNNGWAVGEYGLIYHTKNGGRTWIKEAGSFGISMETGNVEGGNMLFSVVAIDTKTAWASGISGYVTKTENGGKTWKKINTPIGNTQIFCVGSDKRGTIFIGGKHVFFISRDGGKKWERPEFKPDIAYGWVYGIARRGSSGFATVGWGGAIYLYDVNKLSAPWQRVEY